MSGAADGSLMVGAAAEPPGRAVTIQERPRRRLTWPLRGLLANPATQSEAWSFVKVNWTELRKRGGSVGAQRIIGGTKALRREEWLADVERFFRDPANRVASAERTLTQTLEFIRLGLEFRRAQQDGLVAWLRSRVQS